MTTTIHKLAIVGASARAAAFSAMRAGYDVAAADLFADADLARRCAVTRIERYPEGLADWLAATDCDAWMYTGALENAPQLVERMAASRPLAGNGGAALRRARDPLSLQETLSQAGLAFPETRTCADGLPHDGSWLCKTYRAAGGAGVWRLDGAAALGRARQERAVFQRFVAGDPAAALFVVSSPGAELLGVTHQRLGTDGQQRPWQYVGSWGPLATSADVQRQLHSLGGVLAQRLELRGLTGVDLVLAGERAVVVEINPRYPASAEIVERLSGRPSVAAHLAACFPSLVASRPPTSAGDALPPGRSHCAKAIVFARRDVVVTPLFHHWAMTQAALDPLSRILADVPHAGEAIPAGRPVLTVFATGISAADCRRRLGDRLADVESHLYRGQ